jgi:uncharacterized membrane protein
MTRLQIRTAVERRLRAFWKSPTRYIVTLSAALFVGFSVYMTLLFETYVLTGADFGTYVHMFDATLDGGGWLHQGKLVAGHPDGSYWGGHFSATLLLFLPIYALISSPVTLIVAKSFLLAVSILALWRLAADRVNDTRVALFITGSYALHPFLWSAWLFDFQEQVLLPLFVFLAYYEYRNPDRSYWRARFLVMVVLILLTNEFLVYIMLGVTGMTAIDLWRRGFPGGWNDLGLVAAMLGAVLAVRTLAGAVIARFSIGSGGILVSSIADPYQRYLAADRIGITRLFDLMASHPDLVVEALTNNLMGKLLYLVAFLAPVLFIALSDEVSLGALGPYLFFGWLLSDGASYYAFTAHYPLYLLPFVYVGTVRALADFNPDALSRAVAATDLQLDPIRNMTVVEDRRAETDGGTQTLFTTIRSRLPRRPSLSLPIPSDTFTRLATTVLVVNLIVASGMAVATGSVPDPDPQQEAAIEAAIDEIPTNATVLTQNDIYPHIAQRSNANLSPMTYTFYTYQERHPIPTPEYILTRRDSHWNKPFRTFYFAQQGFKQAYSLKYYEDGVMLFKRGFEGHTRSLTDHDRQFSFTNTYTAKNLTMKAALQYRSHIVGLEGSESKNIWHGPYTQLPSGRYAVSFRLSVTAPDGTPPARTSPVKLDIATGQSHTQNTTTLVKPTTTERVRTVMLHTSFESFTSNIEFRGWFTSAAPSGFVNNTTDTTRPEVELRSITVHRLGPTKAANTTTDDELS